MGLYVDTPPAPAERNVATESAETLRAQIDLAPERFEAEARFRPAYASLDNQVAETSFFGTEGQPGLLGLLERAGPSLNRLRSQGIEGEVGDVETFGPRFQEAMRMANPTAGRLVDRLGEDALANLEEPDLSPFERRQLQQSIRGAQSARGFGTGMGDAAIEALGVAEGANRRRTQRIGEAYDAIGASQAFYGDPFLTVTGRTSGRSPVGGTFLGAAQNASANAGPSQFSLFNPIANDIFGSNFNAGWNARLGAQNANAATQGAIIGAVGDIIGGASSFAGASDVRLKENIEVVNGPSEMAKKWLGVRVVTWTWNERAKEVGEVPGTKGQGVIAQELQKVHPELVRDTWGDGYLRSNYLKVDYQGLFLKLASALAREPRYFRPVCRGEVALTGKD